MVLLLRQLVASVGGRPRQELRRTVGARTGRAGERGPVAVAGLPGGWLAFSTMVRTEPSVRERSRPWPE